MKPNSQKHNSLIEEIENDSKTQRISAELKHYKTIILNNK